MEEGHESHSTSAAEEAVEVLAQRLHWKFEIVDPSDEPADWRELDEHQREIYRAGIRAVLQFRDVIAVALS
jgi:hypothetical protein